MRILVAGRSGQLARSLFEANKPAHWRVILAGRPEFDLMSAEMVRRQFEQNRPDLVINAAAYTAVDKAEEEEELAFAINRDGPALLADNCKRMGIPLVQISTDYVFDGAKNAPYVEDDPVAPLGVYGRSKLEGEEAIRHLLPPHVILRTAWVHSSFGQNFVKTMLKLAREHNELRVVDDQYGCPSYAPHLAGAIISMIARLEKAGLPASLWGTYHMTGSGETTWCGLACEIFALSRKLGGPFAQVRPLETKDYPTPAKRPANSRLDCSKLNEKFSIALPDWRTGVKECVAKLLQEGEEA